MRVVVVVLSLAVLGGAGYASWYGIGTVSRDTGAAAVRGAAVGASSVRSGSVGATGVRRVRVK
ncbi:MAG: hypothetical protein AAF366_16985 [Pseudomonadota bacterium]